MKQTASLIAFAFLLWTSHSCKKEIPVVLTDTENLSGEPIPGQVTGTAWTNITASFLPARRVMAMGIVSDKLLLTYLDQNHVSALYNGSSFTLSPQSPADFGNSSGIENLSSINGVMFGLGNLGPYGALSFDINQTWIQWGGFAQPGTNMYDMVKYNGEYIGAFGTDPRVRISANGGNWTQVGNGLNGSVRSLIEYNGELIAAGGFTASGSTALNHIARWNGSEWLPLGQGLSGSVSDLAVYEGKLIAVGSFTQSGDGNTSCRYVAAWNGSTWQSLGGGLSGGVNGAIAVLSYGNQLFIGGEFDSADGVISSNVIKWNQNGWQSLAGGVSNIIGELAIYNGHLYVANAYIISNGNFLYRLD